MMHFVESSKGHFKATNSLKTVYIHQSYVNQNYMLYMPNGDLHDRFTSAGPFVSFEIAKRYAEANVGVIGDKFAGAA